MSTNQTNLVISESNVSMPPPPPSINIQNSPPTIINMKDLSEEQIESTIFQNKYFMSIPLKTIDGTTSYTCAVQPLAHAALLHHLPLAPLLLRLQPRRLRLGARRLRALLRLAQLALARRLALLLLTLAAALLGRALAALLLLALAILMRL